MFKDLKSFALLSAMVLGVLAASTSISDAKSRNFGSYNDKVQDFGFSETIDATPALVAVIDDVGIDRADVDRLFVYPRYGGGRGGSERVIGWDGYVYLKDQPGYLTVTFGRSFYVRQVYTRHGLTVEGVKSSRF